MLEVQQSEMTLPPEGTAELLPPKESGDERKLTWLQTCLVLAVIALVIAGAIMLETLITFLFSAKGAPVLGVIILILGPVILRILPRR